MVEYWKIKFKKTPREFGLISLDLWHTLILYYDTFNEVFSVRFMKDKLYYDIPDFINLRPHNEVKWLEALHQLLERTYQQW